MSQFYRIIGNLPLAPIPSNPQALFWFWTDRHSDLDLSWLAGVREISRRRPDLGIRAVHLSGERNRGPHIDGVPGANLIWVHFGSGFFIGNEPVITQPGDIVLFERSVAHQVRASGEYVRTVVTTIARGHEAKYSRYLKDGIFYENFIPVEMPRSVADATLEDFSQKQPRRRNLFSASASNRDNVSLTPTEDKPGAAGAATQPTAPLPTFRQSYLRRQKITSRNKNILFSARQGVTVFTCRISPYNS